MIKYRIAIDLRGLHYDDESFVPESNQAILESPEFDTDKEADAWYRSLNIISENMDLDVILILRDTEQEGDYHETYLLG